MKNVYTFLKEYKQLRESETSERAAELGYEWQRRNVYMDPRSGKRYRGTGTKFEEIPDEQPAERKPGQQAPQAPQAPQKTLDQFKQDAQQASQITPVQSPGLFPTDPADDGQEAEMRAVAASQGMWPHYTNGRKDYHIRKQLEIISADRAAAQAELEAQQAELEAQQQVEPEVPQEPQVAEPPPKAPEEFRTIDKVIVDQRAEEGKNFDNSISRGDIDVVTEESIQRVSDISNTDVNDERFGSGRQSQKQFFNHYSKDSDYRGGLNTLSKSVAKANDRTKVTEMMDAINSGDYLRTINLKKGTDVTVSQLLADAGIDVNNEQQVRQFVDAYNVVSTFIGDDGNWKRGESHELVGSSLGYYEAKHIAEREDLLGLDPAGVQTKAFNLSSESQSELSGLDPVVTDAVFSILPTPARDFLSKSGSPKTFYNPTEKGQQSKTANPIRGSAALHMWAMQDGRDAYALSGQRRSPGEFQVEHVLPLKSGGSDNINNFVMLLRRVNEPRADLSFDKFLEQARRKRDNVDSDLSSEKVRLRMEKSYRASSFNSELSSIIGSSVSSLIGENVFNNVNSGLENSLGKESSKALKIDPKDWMNYQNQVTNFMEKNGLPPDSQLKDMASDQINGLFDIMSENLGVDKSKMNEYLGRSLINNYDAGARFLINKDGNLERGRGGTSPTSGAVLNMQNSIISDDTLSPEEKSKAIQTANQYHQQFKKSRNNYIDNPNSPEAYENYLSDVIKNIDYLTGEGDSPLKPGRKYDNRLTYSERNNIDNDTSNAIMSMLSLDTASVSGGTDVFSPGFQKSGLTPQSKKYINSLREKLISSYVKTSGFSEDEIMNPDSLTKTKRKKIEPLINALENIDRGLQS